MVFMSDEKDKKLLVSLYVHDDLEMRVSARAWSIVLRAIFP